MNLIALLHFNRHPPTRLPARQNAKQSLAPQPPTPAEHGTGIARPRATAPAGGPKGGAPKPNEG